MLLAYDGDATADGGNLLLRPNFFWFLFFLGLVLPAARVFGRRCSSTSGLRRRLGGTGVRAGLGRLRRAVQSGEGSQNTGKYRRADHENPSFEVGPIQEVYGPTNQRSAAAKPGFPKSARPNSFRTATSASLGGPM